MDWVTERELFEGATRAERPVATAGVSSVNRNGFIQLEVI